MKRIERILLTLLCLALLCPTLARPAAADQAADYGLIVAGNLVTPENCDDVLGDGTARYDPESRTLRLAGANLSSAAAIPERLLPSAAFTEGNETQALVTICALGDLTLELQGKNELPAHYAGANVQINYGVYCGGNLTVSGNGALLAEVGGDMSACYSAYVMGDLTLNSGATLQCGCAEPPRASRSNRIGVYVGGTARLHMQSALIAYTKQGMQGGSPFAGPQTVALQAEAIALDTATLMAYSDVRALRIGNLSRLATDVEQTWSTPDGAIFGYSVECSTQYDGSRADDFLARDGTNGTGVNRYVRIRPTQK